MCMILLLFTGFNIMGNPLTYLIILLVFVKFRLFLLKKKSDGIALEILNKEIIFNNSLLLANTKTLCSSIKSINIDKKYLIINDPKSLFQNPISFYINKYFNKDRIVLSNIDDNDIISINQEILKNNTRLI